jgi:phospholipase C
MRRKRAAAILLTVGTVAAVAFAAAGTSSARIEARPGTETPIQHVVVIFQENISFDHYFGTHPNAANVDGQHFTATADTPAVDGLLPATDASIPSSLRHSANLLTTNPNSSLPQRLDSTAIGRAGDAGGQLTCSQDHNYADEQTAFDDGKMDKFVEAVGADGGSTTPFGTLCDPKIVMDYFDGNTVTGLWNYAQHYAMSDNSYGTTFGPSSPGAINLISGHTGGVDTGHMVNGPSIATPTSPNADLAADGHGGFSLTSDAQPYWDDCSTRDAVGLTGQNIGDRLNAAGISWGWFQGGFRPSESFQDALAATGHTGQPTSTFIPDEFKNAGFQNNVPTERAF